MCCYLFSALGMTLLPAGCKRNLCYPGTLQNIRYTNCHYFDNRRPGLSLPLGFIILLDHNRNVFSYISFNNRFILQPILAEHNVNLIGIGFDDFGVKDFMDGNFFKGGIIMLWLLADR